MTDKPENDIAITEIDPPRLLWHGSQVDITRLPDANFYVVDATRHHAYAQYLPPLFSPYDWLTDEAQRQLGAQEDAAKSE